MADSKLAVPRPNSSSPPPHCAICLGTCADACFTESCMHEFCFKCLLEWSKIKAECPLCKQMFKSIFHNIKSTSDYDEHSVETINVEDNRYMDNGSFVYLPTAGHPLQQFHFRTTFTVDTHGEHALQQMLLRHPLLTIGTFTPDRYSHHRRRRGDTSTTFRRAVYNQDLWVYAPPDITGRYRDVTPAFYRSNPAARTRLVPWLNRELNALLYENTQRVMHMVDVIMEHLLRNHICSMPFRSVLRDFLGTKTDHFIHEFYHFMRSPFDMIGYDRHVIYSEHRPSPLRFSDDSDVIVLSDTNDNSTAAGGVREDPVVIDLVDTDSDEPIIVSEERNGSHTICLDENEDECKLPLKLRIKKLHKDRVRKRHRDFTSSSSVSSSSESETSCDRRHRPKKKAAKIKARRYQRVSSDSSDNEENIPLASFAKSKATKRTKKRESSKDKKEVKESVSATVIPEISVAPQAEDRYSESSDESLYGDYKPHVKSKIRDLRSENNAGPSSGRLRHVLKKEESQGDVWYFRPCAHDSDDSDN